MGQLGVGQDLVERVDLADGDVFVLREIEPFVTSFGSESLLQKVGDFLLFISIGSAAISQVFAAQGGAEVAPEPGFDGGDGEVLASLVSYTL